MRVDEVQLRRGTGVMSSKRGKSVKAACPEYERRELEAAQALLVVGRYRTQFSLSDASVTSLSRL